MAGYCTSVRSYFHEPQASENTAQEWATGWEFETCGLTRIGKGTPLMTSI